jgi:UDP-N-acetylglucosamine transferase subunit ALG13
LSTFASVGNATQPFTRMIEGIVAIADRLPNPVTIQHGNSPAPTGNVKAIAFLSGDQFAAAVRDAELVIVHGGAGSLLHAMDAGRVPVVMTRLGSRGEALDDHQIELVEALDGEGKIVWAHEASDLWRAAELALEQQRTMSSHLPEPRLVGLIRESLANVARRKAG